MGEREGGNRAQAEQREDCGSGRAAAVHEPAGEIPQVRAAEWGGVEGKTDRPHSTTGLHPGNTQQKFLKIVPIAVFVSLYDTQLKK